MIAALSGFRGATQVSPRDSSNAIVDTDKANLSWEPWVLPAKWETSMQKVIAYQDRAEDWRRRASKATDDQERGADERMASVWESLARMREKQLQEGNTRPVF